jgi:Protein of unknown function (DUF3309)
VNANVIAFIRPDCSAARELWFRIAIKRWQTVKEIQEMLSTILIVVLILLLIGALPSWPYSAEWGYAPGGVLGTILVIVVILALLGRI